MTDLGRLAFVVALSAFSSAGAVLAFSPRPLHAASLEAPGLAADGARNPTRAPSASVAKSADGHFWAQGSVNGEPVRFLVDTGASAVALTQADARRLGFDLGSLKYSLTVMTASGPSRAARVTLSSVGIGQARLPDVQALVVEDGLDASLLGMTYLGRLSRFEATRQTLTLET